VLKTARATANQHSVVCMHKESICVWQEGLKALLGSKTMKTDTDVSLSDIAAGYQSKPSSMNIWNRK